MTYRTTTLAAAQAKGLRAQTWTAAELYATLPEDGSPRGVWESFGRVRGSERFGLHYMRRHEGNVQVVKSTSVERLKASPADHWPADVVLVHPTAPEKGRKIRILVR